MNDGVLRVNSLYLCGSVADGPGIRNIIFLQGCKMRCNHCHNPSSWDMDAGILHDLNSLVSSIVDATPTKRITISGGEPLLQAEALAIFLKMLKERSFDIALYTGQALKNVPEFIYEYVDYLKVECFDYRQRDSTLLYIGSKNQSFLQLSAFAKKTGRCFYE